MGIWADGQSTSKADEVPEDIDAFGYLQGIYQGRWPYEPHRVRAARECLPFERPKLAVTAIINEDDFATRLERAIARTQASKLIEGQLEPGNGQGPTVEPSSKVEVEGPTDLTLPPSVPDRRFRR